MSQHLEIEYKNLLTKKEYNLLKEFFKVEDNQIKKQVNHYFDTASFILKNLNSALRIREKGDIYEMTLKQPAKIGLLETNQFLQKQEAEQLLHHKKFPEGAIKAQLELMATPIEDIEYFGSLTTNRVEIDYKDGLMVLDYSIYLRTEDFEVEYEVTDPDKGRQIFDELLMRMDIPIRKTENKVQRFYKQKYQQI